jgi:hypothetical protein
VELGAVDRDHPGADESRPRTEREHRAEQLGERPLVAGEKAGDRGVVGDPVGGDHPVGDVLAAVALERARGALLGRIRIEQKRDHHRGRVRGAAVAVWAVVGVERLELDLLAASITNHARWSSGSHSRSEGGIKKACSG